MSALLDLPPEANQDAYLTIDNDAPTSHTLSDEEFESVPGDDDLQEEEDGVEEFAPPPQSCLQMFGLLDNVGRFIEAHGASNDVLKFIANATSETTVLDNKTGTVIFYVKCCFCYLSTFFFNFKSGPLRAVP